MKQLTIVIQSIFFLSLILVFGSCRKSFLEVTPKGSLIAEKTQEYYLLYNTISMNIPNDLGVYMGDDIVHLEPFYTSANIQFRRAFDYEDDIFTEEEMPSGLSIHLSKLYTMNKIINEVMDSEGGTPEQKKAILAEARVARALFHFVFINMYGKPYNASTAHSDPGFPILKSSNLSDDYFERKSVGEVYDFIEKEIRESLPDLSTTVTNRNRMSKAAGSFYLGRVLLFMGRYNEAIPYLENALDYLSNASVRIELLNYNTAFTTGGIFEIGFFGPTELTVHGHPEVINNFVHVVGGQSFFVQPNYYISPAMQAEYGATDARVNFMINKNFSPATPFPGGLKRTYTRSYSNHFGASVPDIYLMLAECYARDNQLTEARSVLQEFREQRMSTTAAAVDNSVGKDSLIRMVIQERKLENLGQGDRFQTIRRLYYDPLFPELKNIKHQVYNSDGTLQKEIEFPEKRLVLRLPLKMIQQNPNMVPNP